MDVSLVIGRHGLLNHAVFTGVLAFFHLNTITKNVKIGKQCRLGKSDADSGNLCLIGKRSIVPDNTTIGKFCKIFPQTDLTLYKTNEIPDFQEVGEQQ